MVAPRPTAEHYATAIVATCRATGEDPIATATGTMPSRARLYAYAAIKGCFEGVSSVVTARCVGALDAPLFSKGFAARAGAAWWSPGDLEKVKAAVRAVKVERAPADRVIITGPSVAERPAPRRRAQDHWAAPAPMPVQDRVDLTAEICADPPPGRSALDQRRAAEAVAKPAAPDPTSPPSSARIAASQRSHV